MTDTPTTDSHRHSHPGEEWETKLLTGVSVESRRPLSHGEARDANEVVNDIVGRLAALTVRRQCNQHSCMLPSTGACEHEDARRDADYLRHILDVLGLPQGFQSVTEGDRVELLDALAQRPTLEVDRYAAVTDD